jgi:hypothetical protein
MAFVIGLSITLSILLGAGLWIALQMVLSPRNLRPSLAYGESLALDHDRIREELARAEARIRAIETAAGLMAGKPLAGHFLRISEAARQIIAEVRADPALYARIRKSLVHHLGHAEAMATRLVSVERAGPLSDATEAKAEAALGDLVTVFTEYRRRMVEADLFDLDTRIALIEEELKAEGLGGASG